MKNRWIAYLMGALLLGALGCGSGGSGEATKEEVISSGSSSVADLAALLAGTYEATLTVVEGTTCEEEGTTGVGTTTNDVFTITTSADGSSLVVESAGGTLSLSGSVLGNQFVVSSTPSSGDVGAGCTQTVATEIVGSVAGDALSGTQTTTFNHAPSGCSGDCQIVHSVSGTRR